MADRKSVEAPVSEGEGVRTRRGPGRPQMGAAKISRARILSTALKLAIDAPLQDLSIVTVAKSINVTPALIHYYIGGRDWLTSGVMNLFYKEMLRSLPNPTDNWREDLLACARVIFSQFARYGGIAAYAMANGRFRVFQLTAFGDRDYGVEVIDRFVGCFRQSGLPDARIGPYANQFIEFLISTGHSTSHSIYPADHHSFLEEKTAKLDRTRYPNIALAGSAPLTADGRAAFEQGCELFLLGILTEVSGHTLAEAIHMRLASPKTKKTARTSPAPPTVGVPPTRRPKTPAKI